MRLDVHQDPPIQNEPYNEVAKKAQRHVPNITKRNRTRKNVTFGTNMNLGFKAADADVVVFGVWRGTNAQEICNYAAEQHIQVVKCELLTKWEQARSLTFKLTIKSDDFNKALDPSTWPFRIGVRTFKRFKVKPISDEAQTPKVGDITILKKPKGNIRNYQKYERNNNNEVRFAEGVINRTNIYETLSDMQGGEINNYGV